MPDYMVKTVETVYKKRIVSGNNLEDAIRNWNNDIQVSSGSEEEYDWSGEELVGIELMLPGTND